MTDPRRTIATKISEQQLQDGVVDLAKALGYKVMHTRPARNVADAWTTPIQGSPGFPDLVLARRGVIFFVELKSEKGTLTRDQEEWAKALGNVLVWRPAQWLDGTVQRVLT